MSAIQISVFPEILHTCEIDFNVRNISAIPKKTKIEELEYMVELVRVGPVKIGK